MTYSTPSQSVQTTLEVKKSLFHGKAALAATRAEALDVLALCKQNYPDARHHCWAYLLGDPATPTSVAMSDDGEPSGTAGKPILNVLQHKGVGNVMLVVSRYFGGIKLGAGGLIRAYSSSAQHTMEQLPVVKQISLIRFEIHTVFKQEQYFRHLINTIGGFIDQCDYQQQVVMKVAIPRSEIALDALKNAVGSVGAKLFVLP